MLGNGSDKEAGTITDSTAREVTMVTESHTNVGRMKESKSNSNNLGYHAAEPKDQSQQQKSKDRNKPRLTQHRSLLYQPTRNLRQDSKHI